MRPLVRVHTFVESTLRQDRNPVDVDVTTGVDEPLDAGMACKGFRLVGPFEDDAETDRIWGIIMWRNPQLFASGEMFGHHSVAFAKASLEGCRRAGKAIDGTALGRAGRGGTRQTGERSAQDTLPRTFVTAISSRTRFGLTRGWR